MRHHERDRECDGPQPDVRMLATSSKYSRPGLRRNNEQGIVIILVAGVMLFVVGRCRTLNRLVTLYTARSEAQLRRWRGVGWGTGTGELGNDFGSNATVGANGYRRLLPWLRKWRRVTRSAAET